MPEVVISDTSCLILLTKINELPLLGACYSNVKVTPEVALEFGNPLPDWIEVKAAKDVAVQKTLRQLVDGGEASAIALALELSNSIVLVDDRKARRLAKSLDLKVTGTLGILVRAKQLKLISQVKPILNKLMKTDFRVSEKLINRILELTGEK